MVEPKAFSEHLFRIHNTELKLRREAEPYIDGFPYRYTYKTAPLPPDGSSPQPILPVLDGLYCEHCHCKSLNRKALREHANKVHSLQPKKDEDLFCPVKL